MNILFTLDYSAPKSGNFIPSLLHLAGEIRKEGGTAVFLPKKLDEERCHWLQWIRESGYPVLCLNEEAPILEQLQTIVRQYKIDIIHSHFSCYEVLLTKNARALRPARVVIHEHMGFNYRHRARQWVRNLVCSVNNRVNGVYYVAANAQKSRSFFFCRHWFVPNGLSLERYYDDPRRAEGRYPGDNVWNAPRPEGEKLCLLLGWHPQFKGLDVAMKAVRIVRQRGVDLKLCVIGFQYGMSREKQAFLEQATGISIHSDFIRYLKSEEDMFSVYRAMDVFLSASRVEAFSYALLEAISQNVPAVVSDIQGTGWAAAYSKSLFYPVEDPEKCADALLRAIPRRNEPSNAEDLVKKYSVEHWTEKMLEIFGKAKRSK